MTNALKDAPRLFRAPVARGAGRIDRKGGEYGAGLIRGAAVITRGEALGHDMWIDRVMLSQVADAINAEPKGTKARFTHPGMSGDGLGKALGRWRNAVVDGDVVRADLHFYMTAHDTPDGDLAAYVMRLAEEDAEAFGVSIAFDPDVQSEASFCAEHEGKDGRFKSPDPDNVKNFPHVRLASLKAGDVVDTPAANPDGLFHRRSVAFDADALLSYVFGSGAKPEPCFGVDADRIKGAVYRYFERAGLAVINVRERRRRARELELDEDGL